MGNIASQVAADLIARAAALAAQGDATAAQADATQALADAAAALAAAMIAPPAGTIIQFAGAVAPAGYLACPAVVTNISRATYAALFAAIGTAWGAGDGVTTFGMPYFAANQTAVAAAGNVGTNTAGAILSHNHTQDAHNHTQNAHSHTINTLNAGSGSIVVPNFNLSANPTGIQTASTTATNIATTATNQATGGAANLPAGMRVMFCVKY